VAVGVGVTVGVGVAVGVGVGVGAHVTGLTTREKPAGTTPVSVTKKLTVALPGAVNDQTMGVPAVALEPGSPNQFVQRLAKSGGPLNAATKLKLAFVAL
jgi:hypothetical protein